MRTVELIIKKRQGISLESQEIEYLVQGYVNGDIPDYQMSAFCMAVFFRGMTVAETTALTKSMAFSGDTIDLSDIPGIKVDKHSTGGVADTTTLILAPLIAAAGVPVAKMSGRGLGHTGGTIDKLESIEGFQTSLTRGEFISQVKKIKLAVAGQSGNIVPADKKLYALRDVTGTVESIPLIASSIMSKKIAAGADAIILDVKAGSGAFMKNIDEAKKLAQAMVAIGKKADRKVVAVVSDMNEPLGTAIGNTLEVEEAISVLRGETTGRLLDLCLILGAQMLILAGKAKEPEEAKAILLGLIQSGKALDKFAEMVRCQGGNPLVLKDTGQLMQATNRFEMKAEQEGYLLINNAEALGYAAMLLGAGRQTKEMVIDLSVGLKLHARTGDRIKKGQPLLTIFYNKDEKLFEVRKILKEAIIVGNKPVDINPLIYEIINK
ncbi:MAG: pyrimidine-nucleoside phosphorylase [Firmicutes bacterium HGW-Firmicutes-12]|jgi:pyrimidine-nucleoside phosphorylase|nr:MAG: pyrimidine-nucleoside phosphorylase [Firmicutes bacterium HGW-Firmicutes-12]